MGRRDLGAVGSVDDIATGWPFSKVITVDLLSSDADYATIQAAHDAAPAGAILMVGPGLYDETLVIIKDISIIGWNGRGPLDDIGLPVVSAGLTRIVPSAPGAGTKVITIGTASEVTLKNLSIEMETGTQIGAHALIQVNADNAHVQVEDCHLKLTTGFASGTSLALVNGSGGTNTGVHLRGCTATIDAANFTASAFKDALRNEAAGGFLSIDGFTFEFLNGVDLAVHNANGILRFEGAPSYLAGGGVTRTSGTVEQFTHIGSPGTITGEDVASWTIGMSPSKPFSKTLTVDPTNPRADHATIQAAINAATSGDTILIGPGTYIENLTLKDGVTLIGVGGRDAVQVSSNFSVSGDLVTKPTGDSSNTFIYGMTFLANVTAASALTVSAFKIEAGFVRMWDCEIELFRSESSGGGTYRALHVLNGAVGGGGHFHRCRILLSDLGGDTTQTSYAVDWLGALAEFYAGIIRDSSLAATSAAIHWNAGAAQCVLRSAVDISGKIVNDSSGGNNIVFYSRGRVNGGISGSASPTHKWQTFSDGEIAGYTEKTTPVNADWLVLESVADANAKRKVQVGNLPGGGGGGVFGSEYHYFESLAQSNTTTQDPSWTQKLKGTTGVLPAGTYRIVWSCAAGLNKDLGGKATDVQLELDDTTQLGKGAGKLKFLGAGRDSNIPEAMGGIAQVVFGTAGTHDLDIDFRISTASAGTAYIEDVRVELYRVA